MRIEAAVAVVETEGPDECAGDFFVDDGLKEGFDVFGGDEAEFADEIGLFAAGHLGVMFYVVNHLSGAYGHAGYKRVEVGGYDIDVFILDGLLAEGHSVKAVDNEVVFIERFYVCGGFGGPFRRAYKLVAGLPGEDCFVVAVFYACNGIGAVYDVS